VFWGGIVFVCPIEIILRPSGSLQHDQHNLAIPTDLDSRDTHSSCGGPFDRLGHVLLPECGGRSRHIHSDRSHAAAFIGTMYVADMVAGRRRITSCSLLLSELYLPRKLYVSLTSDRDPALNSCNGTTTVTVTAVLTLLGTTTRTDRCGHRDCRYHRRGRFLNFWRPSHELFRRQPFGIVGRDVALVDSQSIF